MQFGGGLQPQKKLLHLFLEVLRPYKHIDLKCVQA